MLKKDYSPGTDGTNCRNRRLNDKSRLLFRPEQEGIMYFIFFLLWVIFNGSFTLEIAVFGVVIAAALFAFSCKYMNHSIAKEKQIIKKAFQVIAFIFLLLKEITLANIAVIRLILSQREEIEPKLVTFRSDLKTATARAFLANVITLTPGTITVTLENDICMVHCLDESMAEGIEDLEFQRRLSKLENNRSKRTGTTTGRIE